MEGSGYRDERLRKWAPQDEYDSVSTLAMYIRLAGAISAMRRIRFEATGLNTDELISLGRLNSMVTASGWEPPVLLHQAFPIIRDGISPILDEIYRPKPESWMYSEDLALKTLCRNMVESLLAAYNGFVKREDYWGAEAMLGILNENGISVDTENQTWHFKKTTFDQIRETEA